MTPDKAKVLMLAKRPLSEFVCDAVHLLITSPKQLHKMASALNGHLQGIILYYAHEITNGLLEGAEQKN